MTASRGKRVYQIKQLVFATQAATRIQAQQYEEQLKANLTLILACVEQALSAVDQTADTYYIAKLEIPLGKLSCLPEHPEWMLLFARCLQQALHKIWRERSYTTSQNNLAAQAWRLFNHFIQKGIWPWWNRSSQSIRLSVLWAELWPTYTAELIELLYSSLQQEYWLQRWIYHLSDQQLAIVVQAASKTSTIDLADFYQQFITVADCLPAACQLPQAEQREAYWRLCMQRFLITPAPFEPEHLLAECLNHVASRLQQPYQLLLSYYLQAALLLQNRIKSQFVAIVQHLAQSHQKQVPSAVLLGLPLLIAELSRSLHQLATSKQPAVYYTQMQQLGRQIRWLQQQSVPSAWERPLQRLQRAIQRLLISLKRSLRDEQNQVLAADQRLLTSLKRSLRDKQNQAVAADIENTWLAAKSCQDLLGPAMAVNAPASALKQAIAQYSGKTESYLIPHAGIILLHPFLSSLFQRCHLLKQQSFAQPRSLHKALLLIHFLTTGQTDAAENELMLAKLFCGLPIEAPLVLNEKLTTKQKQQADILLLAVRERWAILKNSSNAGLRRAFLQRPGLLSYEADVWCLRLEKQGYDILLDKLPWALTPVQSPWMQQRLVVEWR